MFLCGDVMTGRGIDQVLPHPGDPQIREPYVRSARRYVELAEAANGPIPAPVPFGYIWGDALAELDVARPDARIINLETSVTASPELWPKGINYRMHPANLPCFGAARIDCCCLANNHVLDCGYTGLTDTIEALRHADIAFAGAGENETQARAAAILDCAGGRVLVFSFGCVTSGIPPMWAAAPSRAGVNLLPDRSADTAAQVGAAVLGQKQPGDVAVVSIHWGANWGYQIAEEERAFARRLVEAGGVDIVHGHSSHHPKAIEVHRGKLILYGCGDFIDDYEGISGYEEFRDDLVLMYLAEIDGGTGKLVRLELCPFQIKKFRLNHPSRPDVAWLAHLLNREGKRFGTHVDVMPTGAMALSWR
ncbi:CapA family protein [Dongia deserti]|uniref:CapA family protein n=1 Tax=Dongia deserti TaxID=2268030 RepID=UPI002548A120|nr:CapA family protein [Dongia deserti]